MSDPTPTPADHLAWAICTSLRPDRDDDGERPCPVPCAACRAGAAAVLRVAVEQVVREPHDGGAAVFHYNKGAEDRQQLVRFRLLDLVAKLEVPHQPRVGEPLPLYQVTMAAGCKPGGGIADDWPAAEIEALRDWLLPEEAEPRLVDPPESMNSLAITAMYSERQRLRALLTEQARVAREAGPH